MTLTNPTAPADQLRAILDGGTCGDVGMLMHLARKVLAERDALAAVPQLEEVWLVDDELHQDPGVWTDEQEAKQRALRDAEADWRLVMGDVPAAFTLAESGDPEDPWYQVMIDSPRASVRHDATGFTVRRLNVNAAKHRPEDVFEPARWTWGIGQRMRHGENLLSQPMSEEEARRRLRNVRALLPGQGDDLVLVRWRVGALLVVRENDQAPRQENPEPAVGSATDNEAHSDANQPTGSNASRPESPTT